MDESLLSSSPKKQDSFQKVVPWESVEKFQQLYQDLYSIDAKKQKLALQTVSNWNSSSLPSAISVTAELVSAQLQDTLFDQQIMTTEIGIEMIMAIAVARFVSIIVGDPFSNLSARADQLNLPRWIVDLRHESVHANLPPLSMLRLGIEITLKHLQNVYWEVEVQRLRQLKRSSEFAKRVSTLVTSYKIMQMNLLKEQKSTDDYDALYEELSGVLNSIDSISLHFCKIVVKELVKPGVFLCENHIKGLGVKEGSLIDESGITFPDKFFEFWFPIFKILHKFDHISFFLEELLFSLENLSSLLCIETAVVIAIHLIQAITHKGQKSNLSIRFKAKGVMLNLTRILGATIKSPHLHLLSEVISLLENPNDYQQILSLSHYKLKSDSKKQNLKFKSDQMVFTGEDLESDIFEAISQHLKLPKNHFSMSSAEIGFKNVPLGHMFQQDNLDPPSVNEKCLINGSKLKMEEPTMEGRFILCDVNDQDLTTEEDKPVDSTFEDDPGLYLMVYG